MVRLHIVLLIIAGIMVGNMNIPVVFAEDMQWRKEKEAAGITVYTRLTSDSRFKEFKGVSVIDAPLDVLLAVLNDVASYPQWMSDCVEARILEKVDDRTNISYVAQGMPWPVRNRELIVRAVRSDALATDRYMKINTQAVKDERVPLRKGFIRINEMQGEWMFEYLGRNRTKVTYWTKADPAGSIPPMIVNMTCRKIPYVSLSGLKRMAQKEQYIAMAAESSLRARIDQLIEQGGLPK